MVESMYPSSFWTASWAYPTIFVVSCGTIGSFRTGKKRDRLHWRNAAQLSLKLVSSMHAIIITRTAARDVFDRKWKSLNLITTRSHQANSVIGIEAGYLLQDTILCALLDSRWSPLNIFVKGTKLEYVRFEGLLWAHHTILGPLLVLFLEFAKRKKERGVFFVEMFLLMNTSTPLVNLRWWLLNRSKHPISISQKTRLRQISAINDAALLSTFFACRIGLIFYMLWLYGVRTRRSILQSYLSIPLQCKSGTAALLVLNSLWWVSLLQKVVQRRAQKKL